MLDSLVNLALAFSVTQKHAATRADLKAVTCEQCGAHYFYQLVLSAETESISFLGRKKAAKAHARQVVEKELESKLDNDTTPVPCPKCQGVQKNMLRELRRKHSLPIHWWAERVLGGGFIAALFSGIGLAVSVAQQSSAMRIGAWGVVEALSIAAVFVGTILWRRQCRIRRADGSDPLFQPAIREARKWLLPTGPLVRHLAFRRDQLATILGGDMEDETLRPDFLEWLRQVDDMIARVAERIPRELWDTLPATDPGTDAKEWTTRVSNVEVY